MDELLKRILPLALAAAVNPTVLAAVVATLTGSRRKATSLCLGFTLAFAGIGVVVLALGLSLGSGGHSRTSAIIDLVVAGLLLVLAVRTMLRQRGSAGAGSERRTEKEARPRHMGRGGAAAVSLAAGLALGLTDLSSLIPYGVALKDMSTAHLPETQVLVAEAVFLAIAILPVCGRPCWPRWWLPGHHPGPSRRCRAGSSATGTRWASWCPWFWRPTCW